MKVTTDKALIFSAISLVVFTSVCVKLFVDFQSVPDSLVVAFFGAFSFEAGLCSFVHKLDKDRRNKPTTVGDITGFDDAEVVDDKEEE